jgi:hypothetical protein
MASVSTTCTVSFLLGGLTQYNFGDAEVVIVMWAMAGVLMRIYTWVVLDDQNG